MKTIIRYRFGIVIAAAILLAAGVFAFGARSSAGEQKAPAAAPPAQEAWMKRCTGKEGEPNRQCEVFQRLVVKETGQRFAEFAVGFPPGSPDARGVIVLPLGILLTEDLEMQIDEGKKFRFKVRYCTPQGCVAFVNLNKGLLDDLRKGTKASIAVKSMAGQDMTVPMTLNGFSKALKGIQGA